MVGEPESRKKQESAQPVRDERGRFRKGFSGNPGGRPREIGYVRELARQHTDVAIQTLIEMAKHGKPDRTRVAAAEALLDRGYGRPTTHIAGDDDAPPIRVDLPD